MNPRYPGNRLWLIAAHARLGQLLTMALLVALAPLKSALASDEYQPFIEPLQVTQKRAYYSAAPAGQDEPLPLPSAPVTIPVEVSISDQSRLEALAKDRQDTLQLEDTAQAQALVEELEQFGYDIFNRVPSTFAPVEGIPVPANYRIGPGDTLVIQLFGKRNVEYNLVVTRDGKVLIPEFGPVTVGGLSFDDAETLIASGFEQRVIGARAVVTMGRLRTIQIRVSGDVRQPGIYTLGGLSTLIDALLTTGGVSGVGSLRDIQLIREGAIVARLDLYELLLRGTSDSDVFLRHNDTIFVPPIGDIVYVGGEVQRPAIYELRGESRLAEVIDMAGGLLPTASLANSIIERVQGGQGRTVIDFHRGTAQLAEAEILRTRVLSGDTLRILPVENELDGVVMFEGHVERPGAYEYEAGMRLSTLLRSTDALLQGADLHFALIEREDPVTLRSEVRYAAPIQALNQPGSERDPALSARDRVRIFSLDESRAETLKALREKLERQAADPRAASIVTLAGAIRHPGRLPLAEGARLLDVIALGGGLLAGADTDTGFIARTRLPSLAIEVLPFSVAAASGDSGANLRIARGDRVYFLGAARERVGLLEDEVARLREQARFGYREQVVGILGEVLAAGDYPLSRGMRASDLLCAARGLSRRAEGTLVALSRDEGYGARVVHQNLDSVTLMRLCAESRRANNGEHTPEEQARFALAFNDERHNPALRPRDRLAVSIRPGWSESAAVTLSGEIVKPGVYVIAAGETLCSVLERAGGLTGQAYTFGAEFTRESVRAIQQQTLDELQDRLDDLVVELSLSHSFNNAEKYSHEWAGKQDTLRVIRQLERAEATGRMVVDLDKVQRCRRRDALALENGDRLFVPRRPNYVQVAGQVYVATAHLYEPQRRIEDYVKLSGGHTVLGRSDHTYVVQANGEVLNLKGSRKSRRIARTHVMPGARIYVPLNVDRMNPTERAQSWVSTLAQSALLAGIVFRR